MLFKVTHIDEAGHRHRAQVSARNSQDATDQMERQFGEARGVSCMRLPVRPVLRVLVDGSGRNYGKGVVCGR